MTYESYIFELNKCKVLIFIGCLDFRKSEDKQSLVYRGWEADGQTESYLGLFKY